MKYLIGAMAWLATLCFATLAHAQAVSNSLVDLTPIINTVIDLLYPVVGLLIARGIYWLFKLAGIKRTEGNQAQIDNLVALGLNWAKVKMLDKIEGRARVDVKNDLVRMGVTYIAARAPDLLKSQGITGDKLAEMVEARLPVLAPEVVPMAAVAEAAAAQAATPTAG